MSTEAGSSNGAAMALIVALPLVYLLSIGPVAFICEKTSSTTSIRNTALAVYAPIIWLHDHTPMKMPLEEYVNWWERLARKP
jgi:hypothetical protein